MIRQKIIYASVGHSHVITNLPVRSQIKGFKIF